MFGSGRVVNRKTSQTDGFTLIEVLLYLTLSAATLLAIMPLLSTTLRIREKNKLMLEIQGEGTYAARSIAQIIRNAKDVQTPLPGETVATLVLRTFDNTKDPTTIDVNAGRLRVTEGGADPVFLTAPQLTISNFSTQDLSSGSEPSSIRLAFALSHSDAASRSEYEYTETFAITADLRVKP